MKYYSFADLLISMTSRYETLTRRAEKYLLADNDVEQLLALKSSADIQLNPSDDYIKSFQDKHPHLTLADAELILISNRFETEFIKHKGFVLHSSSIAYKEKAVLFSAASGVGKSTHTHLWQEVFGSNKVQIINDDRGALRFIDNSFTIFGTPFSGNSDENQNVHYPVHAIVFLEQSKENCMKRLNANESLPLLLFNTPQYQKNPERMSELLFLADQLLKTTPIYLLSCNTDKKAALLAEQTLFH